jgi:MoaA/NifB/PqqE/SkfB family radical SAM enzyme
MAAREFEIGKVEVLMGWRCNSNCVFCSVGHKLREDRRVKPWPEVRKDIDFARKSGAGIISFSGGEPTIRPDIFKALQYAREHGFETIEVQTNARLLSYRDFARSLIDSGANRFLISIHAHNPELGDFLARSGGSWKQSINGIKNLKSLGMDNIRFSTVACSHNYAQFPEIIGFLLQFRGVGYHMGFVIPDGHAYRHKDTVPRMTDAVPYLKEAIDKVLASGSEAWLYSVPYCLMQGYEHVVAEMGISDTILRGPDFEASIQRNRRKHRLKARACRTCRYDPICIGVWRRYAEMHGFGEFRPAPGRKIRDSGIFMKQHYRE